MSGWFEALVSVRFDLDKGPVVEHVVPEGKLPLAAVQSAAKVGFPDCNPDCGHDFIYALRLKSAELPHLHGAAYYRQKRDPSLPRGYVQQALIVLSRLPYVIVHELVLRVLSSSFGRSCDRSPDEEAAPTASSLLAEPTVVFAAPPPKQPSELESQEELLLRCWKEIEAWPSPHPHVEYEVQLNTHTLHFVTPPSERSPTRYVDRGPPMLLDDRVRLLSATAPPCLSQQYLPIHTVLQNHIPSLTKLWELVIAHEPILVLANTPVASAATALSIAALVTPVRYTGEIRPYFTVQDESFAEYSSLGKSNASPFPPNKAFIIAGTNPFFVRAFSGWKHTIATTDPYAGAASFSGMSPTSSTDTVGGGMNGGAAPSGIRAMSPPATSTPTDESTPKQGSRGREDKWDSLLWGFHDIFNTTRKFVLDHKEHTGNLQHLLTHAGKLPPQTFGGLSRSMPENSGSGADEMIRKFFASLTNEFLQPLQHCFNGIAGATVPLQLCCTSAVDLFAPTHFMAYLESSSTSMPKLFGKKKRKDCLTLYRDFVHGPLFDCWIRDEIDAFVKQQLSRFDASAETDGKTEMQVIDMFLNLQKYIAQEENAIDPDVVLVSSATAALAELALHVREPLRSDFLTKLDNVRLKL